MIQKNRWIRNTGTIIYWNSDSKVPETYQVFQDKNKYLLKVLDNHKIWILLEVFCKGKEANEKMKQHQENISGNITK